MTHARAMKTFLTSNIEIKTWMVIAFVIAATIDAIGKDGWIVGLAPIAIGFMVGTVIVWYRARHSHIDCEYVDRDITNWKRGPHAR